MFNKTYVTKHTTEYVPYTKEVKVTEQRAPTDESLKLLQEMERKVEKRFIENHIWELPSIDTEIQVMLFDNPDFGCRFEKLLVIHAKINGKDFTERESYGERYRHIHTPHEDQMIEFQDTFYKCFTRLLVNNLLNTRNLKFEDKRVSSQTHP